MLERIVSDILVRVLGSYVDGLNRESIRLGVWSGDLELKSLRLRPDALAVLFESLGLDLPVTVTAGYVGLLRLEVPWKALRSAPVRIFMQDLTIVASPVSDGDQSALELREKRLKGARLATDEAIRDAKFSVRSMTPSSAQNSTMASADAVEKQLPTTTDAQAKAGSGLTRWGWHFTSKFVTKIVDNIQVDVENVIVQYEDASSVRDRPYTASLAFDSLRACSTNSSWLPVFIESPTSPVVHKVVYMKGLVLNWEPGNSSNAVKEWILNSAMEREDGKWAGFVRKAPRHAIRPMDGELRIALTKSSALASAMAGTDESLNELKNIPRVQMDLHFPEVKLALDDFQYHTLLSTIMYLSDIDRKVRPKTATGRWFWALDRLLPRFKERREATLRFNAEGIRKFRGLREIYCRVRNSVVRARRSGSPEPNEDAVELNKLEALLNFDVVMLFRDIADREIWDTADKPLTNSTSTSRFWSFFSRQSRATSNVSDAVGEGATPHSDRTEENRELTSQCNPDNAEVNVTEVDDVTRSSSTSFPDTYDRASNPEYPVLGPERSSTGTSSKDLTETDFSPDEVVVPNFRMGFLLGSGSIELRQGGYPSSPIPISSLEFGELRIGIETRPGSGLLLEALLGTFEVVDLQKRIKIMYPRVPWAGELSRSTREAKFSSAKTSISQLDDLFDGDRISKETRDQEGRGPEAENTAHAEPSSSSDLLCASLDSYPKAISDAIFAIRGEYGLDCDPSLTGAESYPNRTKRQEENFRFGSESSSESDFPVGEDGFQKTQNISIDFSQSHQTPLKYIAALRLNHEEVLDGDWASGATRMAMDLAIGGMEVLLDGPQGAFISSVTFWHPREKMPSIMQFLARSAAPRLASLRMDIQRAILDRSVPMRMDILIRAPRFIMPASKSMGLSLVFDLGTFAMETSTGPLERISFNCNDEGNEVKKSMVDAESISVRYTDYKMAFSELGLYVFSERSKEKTQRIIRPFSVHLLLQVMHNSSFVEAVAMHRGKLSISKVKLQGELPSLRIYISHDSFRDILKVAKGWGVDTKNPLQASGIEPNRAFHSRSLPAELEEVRYSHQHQDISPDTVKKNFIRSPLVSFSMTLEFEDLQLELRDSMSRRIVTISSSGTHVKMMRRPEVDEFEYQVRSFTVIDGSRGATAPFRRLAYAGVETLSQSGGSPLMGHPEDPIVPDKNRAFIALSYRADVLDHQQSLSVTILSLSLVCVRETYFALADFFYLKESHPSSHNGYSCGQTVLTSATNIDLEAEVKGVGTNNEASPETELNGEGQDQEYSDPFTALGITTSDAARALRDQAGKGMEMSKQAFADRGKLSVNAVLDGLSLTLVTAEGAIACFDVSNFRTDLTQHATGAVEACGELGAFSIRDFTSAFDVYSETIRYSRGMSAPYRGNESTSDGWSLRVPNSTMSDIWLEARLRNVRIVYLHRFIVILKKYFDVLRESLKPVLEMKGGIAEVFREEGGEDFPVTPSCEGRLRVRIITENVDIVMPRHSQSPYEALRFFVLKSSITNEDLPTPGYQVGFQITAEDVDAHVLYVPPAAGEGRALTLGGTEPVLKQITPNCPITDILPFSKNIWIVAKLDTWRRRRVPEVVLNAEGIPVLKDGQEEREYDPGKWLPSIRVRVTAPNGISARLCEAEYSILYFTLTENIIERPDIEFTDIVRGLKTPVLPTRKPVQPILFSSNRMPPNYQILFEVPVIKCLIMSGADGKDEESKLMRSELRDLVGSFEYGVDYRMTIDVSANMHSLADARPYSASHGRTLIMPTYPTNGMVSSPGESSVANRSTFDTSRSVTLTWDRPFGFRANVMLVVSDLRIIVEPELFRDIGALTAPGFPFLKSSAPPPLLRFNGRLLIVTISRPEIWLMANQYPGDGRSLIIRGDVIAKVMWAAVTGRNTIEVAARGVRMNLSNVGPVIMGASSSPTSPRLAASSAPDRKDVETPMLYSCDLSMKFEGRGYDPPKNPCEEPRKAPGSTLTLNAESFLVRVDVNDAPLILAVGSRLVRLQPSTLSQRPEQPGRFDEWIDDGEDGDSKLSVHILLPHSRLMFTDTTLGRYVPIMEARLRNAVLRSNVPWLTNAALEFALDLFNEDKGWWEPGIESFPVEFTSSKGRSGSLAIHLRSEQSIDINVTPNTVSGAARVSKALKSAIEDLRDRLRLERESPGAGRLVPSRELRMRSDALSTSGSRRPSVAAFCVRNETGRSLQMWLPYDSKRRALQGNGDEAEVDTPSEEVLWTALGASGNSSTDPVSNRQFSMSCILCLSGYEAVTLSTQQTGSRLIRMIPDTRDLATFGVGHRLIAAPLTLVWAVSMRDGVPCGCMRSTLRLINTTRRLLEINIDGLTRSVSFGSTVGIGASQGSDEADRDCHERLKPGESWSIPIYAVQRSIRIRPHLIQALEKEDRVIEDVKLTMPSSQRLRYEFGWSEPLGTLASLYEVANNLSSSTEVDQVSQIDSSAKTLSAPLLTCSGEESQKAFCLSIYPLVDAATVGRGKSKDGIQESIDVRLCTPLVIESLLPRPVFFKLAIPGASRRITSGQVVAAKHIDPLAEAHIHAIGLDQSPLAIALGMDNSLNPKGLISSVNSHLLPTRETGDFHPNFSSLQAVSTGHGRYTPFKVILEHDQKPESRRVRLFCDFWLRNRSDTDVFFRDREGGRGKSDSNPKVFLRGRPYGMKADSYVCFSGKRLSFQSADAKEDIWFTMNSDVSDIDKPTSIKLDGSSLLVDVRPGMGRFHRTLVVTIRNSVWLQNRTSSVFQWCQPAALILRGIALASKVHSVQPGEHNAIHWDFRSNKYSICFRRCSRDGSSDWMWSRPVFVDGVEGEFAAKMYRPKRHEQYIARVVVSKLGHGVVALVVNEEDRNTPPYRIVNHCTGRSIAFRQSGVNENLPWLVRPGRSTRYAWDDPQAPVKKRSLVVEVIETPDYDTCNVPKRSLSQQTLGSKSSLSDDPEICQPDGTRQSVQKRYPKFELNIDIIQPDVPFGKGRGFLPDLKVSICVDGPTKVVTFTDEEFNTLHSSIEEKDMQRTVQTKAAPSSPFSLRNGSTNLDVEFFVKGLCVSFVDAKPTELAYLSISGVHFRLDRFDGQQLIVCDIQEVQLDNQLDQCTWPVVLWSPPPSMSNSNQSKDAVSSSRLRRALQKPFFQFTINGPCPSVCRGIGTFKGIFVALQQMELAADEDFVLRVWLYTTSLIEAAGGSNRNGEPLNGCDGFDMGLPLSTATTLRPIDVKQGASPLKSSSSILSRMYVENLELCPIKLSVSFTSSRPSSVAEYVGGFRYLIRTLIAVVGNVENAEFRFNALELQHVFDTVSHFRSLILEYYISQCSNQKMVLLASNSLIGNPSALFDSIAIGTRDFFVEPANAKGSADFIASIGRGSSSLLTNTVGGLVGSLGEIPRAVAQGLETAVGDRDYLAERDSIRGGRARVASSAAQGLFTGALSFGHGIASGAAGLIRDPIQGAANEGATGFIKGLGRGFIGGVLKPITGALDLISEPAAGFRSMMVSDKSKKAAEPVRPPRAFLGPNRDRMGSYDFRAALGEAILFAVNRGERRPTNERLKAWSYLMMVQMPATENDIILFLWALLRRSTRSTHQMKYLIDAQGKPQRAEEMRAGLVTAKRFIVTSLDGQVLWEHPLVDIIDCYVSLKARDYLMVGVRPVGTKSIVAPTWKRLHCGSMASRDALYGSLTKEMESSRIDNECLHLDSRKVQGLDSESIPLRGEHRRDYSVEMVDMSFLDSNDESHATHEPKLNPLDGSLKEKCDVFADVKLPGRREESEGAVMNNENEIVSDLLTKLMAAPPGRHPLSVRSTRLFFANYTSTSLHLVSSSLASGRWVEQFPNKILPCSVATCEADGSTNRVADVSGRIFLKLGDQKGICSEVVIRFLNPLLAPNAYSIRCPSGYVLTHRGGEKGDHIATVLSFRACENNGHVQSEVRSSRSSLNASVEPVLFGKNMVSPDPSAVSFDPPHSSGKKVPSSDDHYKISQLASLGFSQREAKSALEENDSNLSLAYSMLIDKEKDE